MITPILKYPGGKTKELDVIKKLLPDYKNYYEPFLGGGAVWLNIEAKRYYVNDISDDLMGLYKLIKENDIEFYELMKVIDDLWNIENEEKFIIDNKEYLLKDKLATEYIKKLYILMKVKISKIDKLTDTFEKNLQNSFYRKQKKYCKLKKEDIIGLDDIAVTVVKDAIYMSIRELYNTTENEKIRVACFWFLREYAYSSMFRFNSKGEFNVPYGGKSYNKKMIYSKIKLAYSSEIQNKLENTELSNVDFEIFFNTYIPKEDDFVFLDPPYDSEFSTYDKNVFDLNKQKDLAEYLINNLNAKFMLVIKETDFIKNLYREAAKTKGGDKKLFISSFEKNYQVSFKNRNNKKTTHLIITNYRF